MVPFLQLAAEKKAPFLVHPKQIFGPSYFARALKFMRIYFFESYPPPPVLTLLEELVCVHYQTNN